MITLEMMPPLMFSGLVLSMLIGFPVAFTLAAVGLSFGFLAIHLGFFDLNFLQAIPGRVFGSVLSPTTCCSRFRFSRLWAQSLSAADSRKTCSIRWASCLGPSAAASAIQSSLWALFLEPSPARWRRKSSPWR